MNLHRFHSAYCQVNSAIQFSLADDWLCIVLFASSMGSAEHAATRRLHGSEFHESDRLCNIVVDRFHSALHQVGLMPEAGASRIPKRRRIASTPRGCIRSRSIKCGPLEIGSRRLVHFNVTEHPTAEWTLQQLREALPGDADYKSLLHDRHSTFSANLDETVESWGIRVLRSPVRMPTANAYCERVFNWTRPRTSWANANARVGALIHPYLRLSSCWSAQTISDFAQ